MNMPLAKRLLSAFLALMNMPLAKRLLSAFLISILIFLLIAFGTLDSLDQAFSDRFYQHAGVGSRDILVIGMDQASLDTLGPMPWPRNYMAEAVTFLNNADPDARPAVIGIDVLYSGENLTSSIPVKIWIIPLLICSSQKPPHSTGMLL